MILFLTNIFSQKNIFIKINDNIFIDSRESNKNLNITEAYLKIDSQNEFNSYYFLITLLNNKNFDESCIQLTINNEDVVLEEYDLNTIAPCELHNLLSSGNIYLFEEKNNILCFWSLFYLYTSKNRLISKQKTKI